MKNEEAEREMRRRARASWPGRKVKLGEETDDYAEMSPNQRLACVWEATLNAWVLSGRRIPRRARARWPGRIVRAP